MNDNIVPDALATYVRLRPRIFAIAYRMLGRVSDADDIVQDVYFRWERAAATARNDEAMLVTITTNLCLDRMRAYQRDRANYVGMWLPEPLIESPNGPSDNPAAATEFRESLGFAVLTLLERLDPVSRAVFVLHDLFGIGFDEIAPMVDRTATAVRQIAVRARARIRIEDREALPTVSDAEAQRAIETFLFAVMSGDATLVMSACSSDVMHVSDGGGYARAALHPIIGPKRVSRFSTNLAKRLGDTAMTLEVVSINGSIGLRLDKEGVPFLVDCFDVVSDPVGRPVVSRVWRSMNPHKLAILQKPRPTWR